MLVKTLFILGLMVVTIAGEAALRRAPYPASGWRPRIPFNLPGEYGPPKETELDQQQNTTPQQLDVEITEQRVDFVGQFEDSDGLTTTELPNAYLPPADSEGELLDEQQLPTVTPQPAFNSNNKPNNNIPNRRRGNRKGKRVGSRFPVTTTALPPQSFDSTDSEQQNFDDQFLPVDQSYQPQPAREYGTPFTNDNGDNNDVLSTAYPDPTSFAPTDEDTEADIAEQNRSAIEALNAALDAYNRARARVAQTADAEPVPAQQDAVEEDADVDAENFGEQSNGYPSSRYTQGQYYILAPDNSLQRVRFVTGRDEQDLRTNGFSAKLKYRPVGMLRDPIYRYNSNGQLVRLVKK